MRTYAPRVHLRVAVRGDVLDALAERAEDAEDIYYEGVWCEDSLLRAERIFRGGFMRHIRQRFSAAKTSPFAALVSQNNCQTSKKLDASTQAQ